MRRLPGRYWPRVALVTAVQESGTVLSSPCWNVVTNPSCEAGAAWWPPSMNSTPATMSTTASAATPQTQVIRDRRRERAAALRLREPGPGPQPGSSRLSSCQEAAGAWASPVSAGAPGPGRACGRGRRVSWPARRGVTPGPAQGGAASSLSACRPSSAGRWYGNRRPGGPPWAACRTGVAGVPVQPRRLREQDLVGPQSSTIDRRPGKQTAAVRNVGTGRTIGPQARRTGPETPNQRARTTARRSR